MTETASAPRLRFARFRDLALLPAIVVLMIVGALVDPVFLSADNLTNVLQQRTELSLLVLGQALVLISGKIDLSLESTIGLAPALALGLIIPASAHGLGVELPEWTAIPLCLLIGVVIGAFNGFLILKLQLSAFIVTLGMLTVLRGLQIGFTEGQNLFEVPLSFTYLGSARWFGVPASVLICLVAFALGIVALAYFRQGRSIYAIGGNVEAARAAGIRTERVLWTVLVIASLLAALAGLLMTGRLGSVGPAQGQGMIFTVFAAAVIGGVSLDGGKGTIFGALTGVLALGLIENILTLGGVSPHWIQAIYGAIILIALMLARLTSGKAQD
ncbi:ABC transporter permease [Allokutzneria albata]|uniref:Simple sugar transport system permease protein n=1 Tax=Allokutzneria albata TaxID=211114 RepID=A0A1H0AT07_ALLAB|nr:ABC transporter permease [Allokutzneria albata]SDN36455.1 simple sugar transport system permease protein [Allokutzneria albata]